MCKVLGANVKSSCNVILKYFPIKHWMAASEAPHLFMFATVCTFFMLALVES